MAAKGFKLSVKTQIIVYLTFGLLFLSGVAWQFLHDYGAIKTAFQTAPHWGELYLLRLHGLAAMASLVVIGSLLPVHVVRAWKARRNRRSGALFLATNAVLIFTGYGLYYAAAENNRALIRQIHWLVGLAFPLLFALHIFLGKRRAKSLHS